MALNELSTNTELLSRESDTYQQVYDLLEEHTFTPIIDAWKRRPARNAIRVTPLRDVTLDELARSDIKFGHKPDRARHERFLELRRPYVLLHVNDQTVAVHKEVAVLIEGILAHGQ